MRSTNDAIYARSESESNRPGFIRIHFGALSQAHRLLRRLIRSGASRTADLPSLESLGIVAGEDAYCLIDASVDAGTRCAAVFRTRPSQELLFGGVYRALSLETPTGAAYLELLKRPSPFTNGDGAPAAGAKAAGDPLSIDSSLSTLLVRDGATLRSAVLEDVTHLSAEQNYIRLHLTNGESVVMRGPLQKYATALPPSFLRLSRRLIVNVSQVQRVQRVTRDLCVVSFILSEETVRLGRKASLLLRNAMLDRSALPMARASHAAAAPGKDDE